MTDTTPPGTLFPSLIAWFALLKLALSLIIFIISLVLSLPGARHRVGASIMGALGGFVPFAIGLILRDSRQEQVSAPYSETLLRYLKSASGSVFETALLFIGAMAITYGTYSYILHRIADQHKHAMGTGWHVFVLSALLSCIIPLSLQLAATDQFLGLRIFIILIGLIAGGLYCIAKKCLSSPA